MQIDTTNYTKAQKRCIEFYVMRQNGSKLKDIGSHFGVSITVARHLITKAELLLNKPNTWHAGLSDRIVNAFRNCGHHNLESICYAIILGKLNLTETRMFGKLSIIEFTNWLSSKASNDLEREAVIILQKK